MNVFFCTTCKGRTSHIEQTLPANLHDNPKARIVLVNYNSPDHLDDFIKKNHSCAVALGRLSVYRFTEPGPFRMAHAKNLAHRLAIEEGADILVNVDADNYAGEGFDEYAAAELADGKSFLWAHMKKGQMRRGISGRIAVTKDAFLLAGGYDEVFHEWGPDDKDFNTRLRRLGFSAKEIDPRFLTAVNHNDKMRFREYPHLRKAPVVEDHNLPGREGVRIANAGSFGLGVVYKNFGSEPIELLPLPTRIFGIGLHKTATTSLHRAFLELGYASAHWPSAHWAKAIWEETIAEGRSRTLEQSYALSDLPIPLLFKELDTAYPGSKFVLTIRDEDVWLESMRKHFSDRNPFYSQWDTDPFTHQIHTALYGRRKFDEQVMLERYRRHNAEVKEYFKSRPRDLLVMNMSGGAGWYEICGFLRRAIPSAPYPKAFVL
jgi:sulfotransferase family protein/glycosyl transferase family 7 (putative galactosyltransferase)